MFKTFEEYLLLGAIVLIALFMTWVFIVTLPDTMPGLFKLICG